ncbi:DNA-binding transcriptional LysR family regulator [Novosphingobium hassiacum]|uniref:DNA-binding transcriptional LysR family regulator n=1 Tax=Novosphingobium hassiacum TaxID=173676 RepID=A0A7W6EU60_9SPHN|nr:LysR family transcriptional regulator [Novosphingobium hassiacum]MBB3858781.1 DNA-binding transcriptional LysR family regulator [Novosphingobium hassiacum]
MDFDERQLRAFLAVAETGSLGRAARIANLTQPSLSRLIKSMEDRLGHPLFERGSKGMSVTTAGQLLTLHARHIVSEMQSVRDELAALSGLKRGVVRIGAVAAVMRTLVAETVGNLLASAPDLGVELVEAVDDELLDALVTRRVDLVVAASPLDHPEVQQIGVGAYRDGFAVFGATDHCLPPSASIHDVLAQNWVMPGTAFTPRVTFERLLAAQGFRAPRVAVETASVESMIAVSAHSRLLCWLPEPLLAAHVASGSMRKFGVPELTTERAFLLHRRRSGLLPDAARRFVELFPLEG